MKSYAWFPFPAATHLLHPENDKSLARDIHKAAKNLLERIAKIEERRIELDELEERENIGTVHPKWDDMRKQLAKLLQEELEVRRLIAAHWHRLHHARMEQINIQERLFAETREQSINQFLSMGMERIMAERLIPYRQLDHGYQVPGEYIDFNRAAIARIEATASKI